MSHFNWIELVSTSPITIVILGCSIVAFGIAIERAYYFWKRRGDPDKTLANVMKKLCSGDIKEAIWACNSSVLPVARVILRLLESPKQEKEILEEQTQIALSEQKMLLERNLAVLGTMSVMAPLIGLLGTVWGIMRAFNDMALTGSAAPSVVAAGVAEALITTAFGLIVAIPSLMLYNHFTQRTNVILTVAENRALDFRSALIETQALRVRRQDEMTQQRQRSRGPERESREETPELIGAGNRSEEHESSWAR